MNKSEKVIWSKERSKWLCYDNQIIDKVLNSKDYSVPTYDYSEIEKKFNIHFELTKQVIKHFPLANEGNLHHQARSKMSLDINANLTKAISVFKNSFGKKISKIDHHSSSFNIAKPITESILESNLVFADIDLDDNFDYSDLTLMLDDSQSIKSRLNREKLIKLISSNINNETSFYKIAILSVGVNALISTVLHSIIKILTNDDYRTLVKRKYFVSNGIKHLERICIKDNVLAGLKINHGDRMRLYVEDFENANLSESQMNKKFFALESPHSCIGMNYSLRIWKELIKIISTNFDNMRIISFDYRSKDAIFHFPANIYVEYSK